MNLRSHLMVAASYRPSTVYETTLKVIVPVYLFFNHCWDHSSVEYCKIWLQRERQAAHVPHDFTGEQLVSLDFMLYELRICQRLIN